MGRIMRLEKCPRRLPIGIVAERERRLAGRRLGSTLAAGFQQRGEGKLLRIARPPGNFGEFDRLEIDRLDIHAQPPARENGMVAVMRLSGKWGSMSGEFA